MGPQCCQIESLSLLKRLFIGTGTVLINLFQQSYPHTFWLNFSNDGAPCLIAPYTPAVHRPFSFSNTGTIIHLPIRLRVAHSPFSDAFFLILLTEWVVTYPCRLMKKDDLDENETLVDLDCPKRHE